MKHVICLAGGVGTGKTTIAEALSERLRPSAIRSFGAIVRATARRVGLPLDRQSLQVVGSRLVQQGWSAFVDKLLSDVPDDVDFLIIDGIRHVEAVTEIRRRWSPIPVHLVLLRADDAVVAERLRQRHEDVAASDHETESHFDELASLATLTLDTGYEVERNTARVVDLVCA